MNLTTVYEKLVGWFVVCRINIDLAVFQSYRDLEAGDNQSLKFKWRDRESMKSAMATKHNGHKIGNGRYLTQSYDKNSYTNRQFN